MLSVPLEVQKAIENELQKIKDLKQEIYNKEKIQVLRYEEIKEKRKNFSNNMIGVSVNGTAVVVEEIG